MDSRTIVLALCLKYSNDWNDVYAAIRRKDELSDFDILRAQNFSGHFVCISDPEYPDLLRQKVKPPFVLYYEGDISLLSGVDEGRYVFLHGENDFNIPSDRICVVTDDNRLCIAGRLTVWFNDLKRSIDRYGVAAGLCKTIVGTKVYPRGTWSWFCNITVMNAINLGSDIYLVPGDENSWNHLMIQEGCIELNENTARSII